jgi:hypothetical protein
MFDYENLRVIFSFDGVYLFAGALLLGVWTFFYYRKTLPPVSKSLRISLMFLRFSALFLILLLFFNPKAEYETTTEIKPRIDFFIDNSASIAVEDSSRTVEKLRNFIRKIEAAKNFSAHVFFFDNSLQEPRREISTALNPKGAKTNLSNVFDKIIEDEDSLSSAVLVSDGVITSGENPAKKLREITVPVHVLALGNPETPPDIEIKKLSVNSVLYKRRAAPVQVTVFAKGDFKPRKTVIKLFENNRLKLQKSVEVVSGEVKKIEFQYVPQTTGKKRLSVKIDKIPDEKNTLDNKKSVSVEVLDKRKNILVVSDNPDFDITFIKQAIRSDTNFTVNDAIFFANTKSPDLARLREKLRITKAVFFIGYPAPGYNRKVFSVFRTALKSGLPYYLQIGKRTDIMAARELTSAFELTNKKIKETKIQPLVVNSSAPFFEGISFDNKTVSDLPPINAITNGLKFSPIFSVLLESALNGESLNKPLALYSNENGRKFIMLVDNVWKWKLQNSSPGNFDKFFVNIAKWLTSANNKRLFKLFTEKNFYEQTEGITIEAEVYNEFLEPVENAKITAKLISQNGREKELVFKEAGNGIYNAQLINLPPGSYTVYAETSVDGKSFSSSVNFDVIAVNVEKITAHRNTEFLKKIANETKGEYFDFDNYDDLLAYLSQNGNKEVIGKKHIFVFFPRQEFLFFIIFLFTLEWILRKRKGLL